VQAEKKYFSELDKFISLCQGLIEKGGAYHVVIANHELYRFLYPYEPYENFINDDPVNFILGKIIELNEYLAIAQKTIKFYPLDVKDSEILNVDRLEQSTSDLYTSLWKKFQNETLEEESRKLLEGRLSQKFIEENIVGKTVLDMGCGSGRYTLALALLGAKKVIGIDLFSQSYEIAKKIVKTKDLNVDFLEGNFHNLPFENEKFDFIFSNGTIHHSSSIDKSLDELYRVLKSNGKSFLYIYAAGGIFWNTRKKMRELFKGISPEYTNEVLNLIGMPSNRFIFSDVWHVPIETHTTTKELEKMCNDRGLNYEKTISKNLFDLDYAQSKNIRDAKIMWGDGEHRYILTK
jgi:ubiquinone/menaquinone biosynthesis C-methylase UbiE